MTRLPPIVLISAVFSIVGCTGSSEPDFCRDHYLFHAEHADKVGVLTIELAADDTLDKSLLLPDGTTVTDSDDTLFDLTFESDGRLRQIDVLAFDLMPDLDELEVTMTTPATRKHFVISRRCPNPVFRID